MALGDYSDLPQVYHEDFVFDNNTDVHDAKMAIKKVVWPSVGSSRVGPK